MLTNTQKVINGVSSQTIVTIVLGIVEIVSFSIMSRLLSQKDFGYYAAIVAVATIFQSLADNGIGSAIIQKKNLDKSYINNAFSLSLIFGVIVAGLLCVSSGLLARLVADESMTIPLRLFSITLICSCLSSVNISLMQRQLQFLRIGAINLISLVVTTTLAVILAFKGLGYYAILAKAILQSVLVLIISYFAAQTRYSFVFDRTEYKKIFNFSGWLMASSVFRNLAHQTDRLLMSSLFSIEILGLYTRPKEFISNISSKFNSIFDYTLFPVLSAIQDEHKRLQKSFYHALYFLNVVGMIIALLFFCNSELIIRIFFGEKWLNITVLFMVLSIYPIFLINGRIGDIFLRSLALTKQQFIFRVVQFALAVIFIFIGYKFGIIAVAISIILSYLIITMIKLSYLATKINLELISVILTIFKAFKFCIFVIPIYLLCTFILPHSLIGNIIQSIVIISNIAILFFIFPSMVGKTYKEEMYSKIIFFINNKVLKHQ